MKNIGTRIRQARLLVHGRTQAQFAKLLGVSRGAVGNWELGNGVKQQNISAIAEKTGVSVDWLATGKGQMMAIVENLTGQSFPLADAGAKSQLQKQPEFSAGERLPVFAAIQDGAGEMIVTNRTLEFIDRPLILEGIPEAYGFLVVGDEMATAFRAGDTAWVHPLLSHMRDTDVVLYRRREEDGEERAILRTLVDYTATHWEVAQLKPFRAYSIERSVWTKCHRIIGKLSRR